MEVPGDPLKERALRVKVCLGKPRWEAAVLRFHLPPDFSFSSPLCSNHIGICVLPKEATLIRCKINFQEPGHRHAARKRVRILGREAPAAGVASARRWAWRWSPGLSSRAHLSWAILSTVTFIMAWIRSSRLASSFFFISLVSL